MPLRARTNPTRPLILLFPLRVTQATEGSNSKPCSLPTHWGLPGLAGICLTTFVRTPAPQTSLVSSLFSLTDVLCSPQVPLSDVYITQVIPNSSHHHRALSTALSLQLRACLLWCGAST